MTGKRSAEAYRDRRRRRSLAPIPDYVQHGSASAYHNWDCRCEKCQASESERSREYHRRVNPRPPGTPANDNRPWTEAERRVALDLDLPVAHRAEMVGRTAQAVTRYVQRQTQASERG